MRGSAAQGETPQCTVDIDFVHEEHSTELWAATVVQHAWGGWRERMAMLLLLYGFATLDGDPESLCAPLLAPAARATVVHGAGSWRDGEWVT